jgi:hypothetical protein
LTPKRKAPTPLGGRHDASKSVSGSGDGRERVEPLDLSKFPEKDRLAFEAVRDLLTQLNPTRVEEHRALVLKLPDGIGDFEHFVEPAAHALLAYGSAGLEALYRCSIDDPIACGHVTGRVLLKVALQREETLLGHVFLAQRYLSREAYERLCGAVVAASNNGELAAEAKRYISKLIAHYASDPRNRPHLPMVLGALTSFEGKDSPASELVWGLMASATLQISEELCNEAGDLVGRDLDENDYQAFFEKHPALLDPLAASIVPRQALGEMWRTDFVIRRLDDQYVFVELEKPRDALFTQYPQPSATLSHAIGQVLSWFTWVEDNIAYAVGHGFPKIHLPRGLIVIGRDKGLRADQKRMLHLMNDLVNHRIAIQTYDEVIQSARNVVRNLTSGSSIGG